MDLVASGLGKTFGGLDGEPSFILDLPTLSFELGKIVFLMGPNGSGKSMTLRLLGGEMRPSLGRVSVSLGDRHWYSDDRPCPIVRQQAEDNLALDLTVKENLLLRAANSTFWERLFPTSRLDVFVRTRVEKHTELKRKLNQPCRNLSGGQKQALAFLVSTGQNSPILLLDEFLAATDQKTSGLLRMMVKEYVVNTPACAIVVSHNISEALREADRILLLKDGRLINDLYKGAPDWNESFLIEGLSFSV